MDKRTAKLLEENEIQVDCESPLELSTEDGDRATGCFAEMVIDYLHSDP